MECYKYVKTYLAFTPADLPTPDYPTALSQPKPASTAITNRSQIRQGQFALREATRMGSIQLPIIDWMPFPPLLARLL